MTSPQVLPFPLDTTPTDWESLKQQKDFGPFKAVITNRELKVFAKCASVWPSNLPVELVYKLHLKYPIQHAEWLCQTLKTFVEAWTEQRNL